MYGRYVTGGTGGSGGTWTPHGGIFPWAGSIK